MAAFQETCVCECAGARRSGKRDFSDPGSLYSVLLPQPVKLLFLSNSSARSLEIISIMFGSSMQVQAGGKELCGMQCLEMLDLKLCRKKKHLDLVRSCSSASDIALTVHFSYLAISFYSAVTQCEILVCMC